MGDPTPPLDEFLLRYDVDDNEWWRMDSGHHMNLFDEAVERMQAAEERLAEVLNAIGDQQEFWELALLLTSEGSPEMRRLKSVALAATVHSPDNNTDNKEVPS